MNSHALLEHECLLFIIEVQKTIIKIEQSNNIIMIEYTIFRTIQMICSRVVRIRQGSNELLCMPKCMLFSYSTPMQCWSIDRNHKYSTARSVCRRTTWWQEDQPCSPLRTSRAWYRISYLVCLNERMQHPCSIVNIPHHLLGMWTRIVAFLSISCLYVIVSGCSNATTVYSANLGASSLS